MRKISLYTASLLALGLGFTACDQLHNDLRLEPPTSYTLQAPEGTEGLIIFGATGSNVDNKLNVVTFNPYNVNTAVDFQVQVAKSESDFETWDNLMEQAVDAGDSDYDFTNADGLPYATFVSGVYTSPSFTVPGADFCDAINLLYGFETADEATAEPVQVAYRVYAWVPGVEYSFIFSNVVVLNKVQSYIPIREPRKIYLIGAPSGWNIDNGEMYAEETEAGSNIYSGKFKINAGDFIFRFYSELGNWDENSIGSQAEDSPVDIEFTDDKYFGDVVVYNAKEDILGKGSWQYSGWEGGTVDVTVDLNEYTIEIVAHEGDTGVPAPTGNVLYLVGAPQGWNVGASDMYISETKEGSNIYQGALDIPADQFIFRFYSALGDWDKYSVGSQNEDSPVNIEFINDVYTGDVVAYNEAEELLGKGSWQVEGWEGGTIFVTVDLNNNTIKMESNYVEAKKIYIVGACQGWDINSDAMPLSETEPDSNVFAGTYDISAGGLQFKIYTELGNWDANVFGSTADGADENTVITVPYSGAIYPGKGNWQDSSFAGTLTITVDLNNNTIDMK
ncbi:MAG: hypothetical protein J1F67_08500 [Muribaculaceae bacterium]|nr:hypothetical protein [Muribaculaceae bacterium]